MEFSALYNNEMIIKLQNQIDPSTKKNLKKKGLVYNKFEGQSRRPLMFSERKVNIVLLKKNIKKFEEQLDKQF